MKKPQPQFQPSFFEERTKLLTIVAAIAVIVRGLVLSQYHDSIFWQAVWSDASTYNQWAKNIVATGDWIGTRPFFMTPFYPYFLATVYSIFGEDLIAVRLIQHTTGIGTALLLFLISEKLFNRKVAFISALLAAVYGPFVLYGNLLLVETLKVFFVTLYIRIIPSGVEG